MSAYNCRHTKTKPGMNGRVDAGPWAGAEWSPRFVDMVTGAPGWWDTRAAALWDEEALYVGFRVEEPFVRAELTERDSLIFQENDIEFFIDGGDWYYELEVNARNTLYEVLFVWRDSPLLERPEFDPRGREALTFGGDYDRKPGSFWRGTHPRGPRWAFLDWDYPGLQSAVWVDGTLNDDRDIDRGWSVTLALPWVGLAGISGGGGGAPRRGGGVADVFRPVPEAGGRRP